MRITIQIQSGPSKGHRYALATGQQMTFGRSAECDISFPDDIQMSSKHFQLIVDQTTCRMRDLESTNGTSVNEQPADTARIDHEDTIRAGDTTLQIAIEGHSATKETDALQPEATPSLQSPPPPAKIQAPAKLLAISESFVLESCPSGLLRLRGNADQLTPIELAQTLARQLRLALIIDPHRLQIPVDQLTDGQVLLDWLDPAAAAQMSPLLVPGNDVNLSHLENGWGADAVVCLFCSGDNGQLLEQLQQMSRPKDEKEGMLGICWPNVLAHLLQSQQDLSNQLVNAASAILLEDPSDPNQWILYGDESLSDLLNKAGIQHELPEPIESEPSESETPA
jgi:hypothetical protein